MDTVFNINWKHDTSPRFQLSKYIGFSCPKYWNFVKHILLGLVISNKMTTIFWRTQIQHRVLNLWLIYIMHPSVTPCFQVVNTVLDEVLPYLAQIKISMRCCYVEHVDFLPWLIFSRSMLIHLQQLCLCVLFHKTHRKLNLVKRPWQHFPMWPAISYLILLIETNEKSFIK